MSAAGPPVNMAAQQNGGGQQLDPRRRKKGNNQGRNQQNSQQNSQQNRPRSFNNSSGSGNHSNGANNTFAGSNPKSKQANSKTGETKNRRKTREESKLRKEITKDEGMDVEDVSMVPTKRLPKLKQDPLQKFTPEEIRQTGPLFLDPQSLGFLKSRAKRPLRPVPRYMLTQPRLLVTPPFQQNQWDAANQERMLQLEATNNGSDYQGIYEEFQKMRDVERKTMEELGLVDAENITKDLNDAIFFQGSCLDMCPTFERVRRALENNVKSLEKDPATNKISRDRAIKAFSRPAAGQPPPMPSDVRPPHVLTQTLNFLVDNMLQQLPDAHSFIWDRTRSIRQDFVYQNFYGPEAIDCNERIVRIHLISLHIMSGSDVEYSQQQELEQFNKALQTLTEMYQDVRNHGGICPNEAEFRAYHLISHFRDPELEREVQTLPDSIVKDPLVQLALRFRFLMSQNNIVERGFSNSIGAINLFVEFFRLVHSEQTPILLACLLESHFNEVRFYALKSMSRSYHTKGRPLLAAALQEMLGFDNVEQLLKYIGYYEVDTIVEDGTTLVDLFNKEKLESKYKLNSLQEKPKQSQAFSLRLDSKLQNILLKDIVNSGKPNVNLHMKDSLMQFSVQNVQKRFPQAKSGSVAFQTPAIPSNHQQHIQPVNQPQYQGFNGGKQPQTSNGFNSAPQATNNEKSFNLLDFLSSQKGNAGATTTRQFGASSTAQTDISVPRKVPAFDFTAHQAPATEQKKVVHFAPQVEKVVDIKPQPFTLNEKPKSQSISETPKAPGLQSFNFEPKSESKSFSTATPTIQPVEQSKVQSNVISNSAPIEFKKAPSKRLQDSPHFDAALSGVYRSILAEVVNSELCKILPRIIKHENKTKERNRVISALAGELYLAFLSEVTYETSKISYADKIYEKKITKEMLKRWKEKKIEKKAANEVRMHKLAELESVNFASQLLKRKHSSQSRNASFVKRKVTTSNYNSSFENIHERQEEIHKLWMPLNLQDFVERCSGNVKIHAATGKTELKFLLIVEDWTSPYSKWLNTKFSLKSSPDRTHYEHKVDSQKLSVSFESLPKDNMLQEELFKRTSFVLFECGILHESQMSTYKTLSDKLARDSSILQKIVQICDRYCLYQTQIVVLVWNSQSDSLTMAEAASILNIDEMKKSSNSIQNITLCDMSSLKFDVVETLEDGLENMSSHFTGSLTYRGLKKKIKMQKQLEEQARRDERTSLELHLQAQQEAEKLLRSVEEEALRRAKELQKHKYLSRHLVSAASDSVDLTNTTASFRTPNATFANNTLVNLNHSLLANDTTMQPRNGSFLGSFCNASIIEESTPFGSPKPKAARPLLGKPGGFTKPAAPRKIQELKDLTAAIRAKYKK